MCDPVSLAVAAGTVSQAKNVLGFLGGQQAYNANRNAAYSTYGTTYNTLQQQEGQIDAQQSENTTSALIKGIAAQGRISASASSLGGDAASTAAQSGAADFDVGRGLSIQDLNSENQRVQNAAELTGAAIKRDSQINQVAKPSALGLAVKWVGTNIETASNVLKLTGS